MYNRKKTIVKNLDSRYAIILGFRVDRDSEKVYDNEAEAREANGGKAPCVGFVIIDKRTGDWADFAKQAFDHFEKAKQCYYKNVEKQSVPEPGLVCMKLDENLALTLDYNPDFDSDHPEYFFSFFNLEEQKRCENLPGFVTCKAALAYYNRNLEKKADKGDDGDDGEPGAITNFSGENMSS